MRDSGDRSGRFFASPRPNLVLSLIGIVSFGLYRYGLGVRSSRDIIWFIKIALAQSALFALAAWLVTKCRDSRSTLILVIAFAVLFRLAILFAPPQLSDDIYRYVWDGRVQAAGINPYRYIPADINLEGLRDADVYTKINRKDYAHTVYPPFAQIFFLLVTRVSESVIWMKVALVLVEVVTIWAIIEMLNSMGLARQRVLVYAWHPLVIWNFALSGHVDSLAIAFIVISLLARSRNKPYLTGIALGLATLVKLYPIALFPALYKRWDWKMPVALLTTIVAGYIPYLSVGLTGVLGFLPNYAQEEGLRNGTRFFILKAAKFMLGDASVPDNAYIVITLGTLGGLTLWMLWRQRDGRNNFIHRALLIATVFTVLLSPRYGWYFTWLVPFLCIVPVASVLYLTLASFVLYALWLSDAQWHIFALNALIYLPFFFFVVLRLVLQPARWQPME